MLANSFATLRSKLLLVSFGAMLVERAFVSLVKTYGRQEAANKKLQAGLANVADTTSGVTQRLIDYSAALQQATAFGDEMITTGMVQLTTFGLNEEAIKALSKQVLNVARAIQTVSGSMPDLNSLFIAFGKATTTGIGTLTRYGVVLTETERAQLENMDANESAVEIAKILERQYGGLADAYRQTTAGMLEAAAAARGDAAEAFGEVLAPAVLAVAKGLKIMFEAMSVENIKAYGSGLIIAATATTGLAIATGRLNIQLALTRTAMIRTGIGALVVIAGLLTGKLLDMFGVFEDGNNTLDDAEKKLRKFNETLEEDIRLAAELKKAQDSGAESLKKQLALLNAKTETEKMLINLGHEASDLEEKLIKQIVAKTAAIKAAIKAEAQALKAEKQALKDAEKARKDLIKQSQSEFKAAFKAVEDAIKEENDALKELNETISDTIDMENDLFAALDKLMLAEMKRDALMDGSITLAEEYAILLEKQRQAQEAFDETLRQGDLDAQADALMFLNELREEFIKLTEVEIDALKIRNEKFKEGADLVKKIEPPPKMELVDDEGITKLEEFLGMSLTVFGEISIAAIESAQTATNAFSNLTSTMSTQINVRMKNAMDAMKTTTEYQRADSDKRKKMEKEVTDAYAKERTRIANFEKAIAFSEASIAIAAKLADPKVFLNPILFALVAALGAVQLAAIVSTPVPTFARGGMIGGRRHEQGGTMINAEEGEFVMSRSAVESVGIENLNRMNEGAGGGSVTVNVSGNVLSQDFVEGELAENIKEAIRRGTDFGIS